MSEIPGFLIRDALEGDIAVCLSLDHKYETEHVWQMQVRNEELRVEVLFTTERLPRVMEVAYPKDEALLRAMLPGNQCFLVMERKDQVGKVLGYLTMRMDRVYKRGIIQTLVIARGERHRGLGTRLVAVARRWAKEHDLSQLTIETQTKNYPAIRFSQHNGFTFSGFNDQYYPNQDIAVFFSQSLK